MVGQFFLLAVCSWWPFDNDVRIVAKTCRPTMQESPIAAHRRQSEYANTTHPMTKDQVRADANEMVSLDFGRAIHGFS